MQALPKHLWNKVFCKCLSFLIPSYGQNALPDQLWQKPLTWSLAIWLPLISRRWAEGTMCQFKEEVSCISASFAHCHLSLESTSGSSCSLSLITGRKGIRSRFKFNLQPSHTDLQWACGLRARNKCLYTSLRFRDVCYCSKSWLIQHIERMILGHTHSKSSDVGRVLAYFAYIIGLDKVLFF